MSPLHTNPAAGTDDSCADSALLAPVLTPYGRLALIYAPDAQALEAATAARLRAAFARGSGHGLLQLGAGQGATALPAVLAYWRDFAAQYVTTLCRQPEAAEHGTRPQVPPPAHDVLTTCSRRWPMPPRR